MKQLTYKLLPKITDEILNARFNCFNEILHYYSDYESSKESYDENSFHLEIRIDGKLAGYTRLTPCPLNYMNLTNIENVNLPIDTETFEMGRTFVLPEFRGLKLVTVILLIGLHISEVMGYKQAIGNESYEDHLKMPTANGWKFMDIIAKFDMPFSNKGSHKFYLISCNLKDTYELRANRIKEFTNWFLEKDISFSLA